MIGPDDETPTQPIRVIPVASSVRREPRPHWLCTALALLGAVVLGLLLTGCAPTAKLVLRCVTPYESVAVVVVYEVTAENQPALLVVPPRGCHAEVVP